MLEVDRAGRFGTKGLAIAFVADDKDKEILADVQSRFEVKVTALPDEIENLPTQQTKNN